MLSFCVCFVHLHHAYQHFMYFIARKTSKIDNEYTLWGRRRLDQQGFPQWRAPPIQEKIDIASYSSEKAPEWNVLLFKEESENFLPEARFLYSFSWIISLKNISMI